MRRKRRIFAGVGAGVSLLIALATGGMWVRSYWKADGWYRSTYDPDQRHLSGYGFGWERGRVGFSYFGLHFNQTAELKVKQEGAGGSVYFVPYFILSYSGQWTPQKLDLIKDPPQRWWERAGIYARRSRDPIRTTEPTGTSMLNVVVPLLGSS